MPEKFLKNGKKNMGYSINLADELHIYYGGKNYIDGGLL